MNPSGRKALRIPAKQTPQCVDAFCSYYSSYRPLSGAPIERIKFFWADSALVQVSFRWADSTTWINVSPNKAVDPNKPIGAWQAFKNLFKFTANGAAEFKFSSNDPIVEVNYQQATASTTIGAIKIMTANGITFTTGCEKPPCSAKFWQDEKPTVDVPVYDGQPVGDLPPHALIN